MTSTPKPTSQQSTLKDDKLVIRTQLKAGTMGVIIPEGLLAGDHSNYDKPQPLWDYLSQDILP